MAYSKKRQSQESANDVKSRSPWMVSLFVVTGIFVITLLFVRQSGKEDSAAAVGSAGDGQVVRPQPKAASNQATALISDGEEHPEVASEVVAEESEQEQVLTREEKQNAEYERIFESLVEKQKDEAWKPSADDVVKYKRAFDGLTAEQKLEQIPHAQNLLTDASFDCLKAILMDPKEPQDVLESIYYDLLNRPEELKYPVLREVHSVAGHPLRGEIEELDSILGDIK